MQFLYHMSFIYTNIHTATIVGASTICIYTYLFCDMQRGGSCDFYYKRRARGWDSDQYSQS